MSEIHDPRFPVSVGDALAKLWEQGYHPEATSLQNRIDDLEKELAGTQKELRQAQCDLEDYEAEETKLGETRCLRLCVMQYPDPEEGVAHFAAGWTADPVEDHHRDQDDLRRENAEELAKDWSGAPTAVWYVDVEMPVVVDLTVKAKDLK